MKRFTNPKNIHFLKDIVQDSHSFEKDSLYHHTFATFKSIENIFYLIYTNINNSIISYDLEKNQIINEIKQPHYSTITNLHYYFDKNKKKDLILSISSIDSNIKLWNTQNWSILLNLENVYKEGYIKSACFLKDENDLYIVASNFNYSYSFNIEPIKIYDIKGNIIKEIKESKDITFYVDSFYDNDLNKNYIITGNSGNTKAFDYEENKIYHIYYKKDNIYRIYHNILINKNENENEDIIYFIALSNDNYIRIWNFHSGEFLKAIFVQNDNILSYNMLFSICAWDKNYLFAGSSDESLKLIEINSGEIVKNINEFKCDIISMKKIIAPKYGKCLISQSWEDSKIKLWIFQ